MGATRERRRSGGFPLLRSLVGAAVVIGAAAGAYFGARSTSVFSLDRIEVVGASDEVEARVRHVLEPYVGNSLVAFDSADAQRRLIGITELAAFHLDRQFPHTLRVRVQQERPVAVLRRGAEAWLAAASGRVLRRLETKPYPPLPRVWIPRRTEVEVNTLVTGVAARGIRAVAPLAPLGIHLPVTNVRTDPAQLTLVLAGGRELRLGDTGDLRLKLAIARRILPLAGDAAYVDVSVPERPVAGYNPQPEG